MVRAAKKARDSNPPRAGSFGTQRRTRCHLPEHAARSGYVSFHTHGHSVVAEDAAPYVSNVEKRARALDRELVDLARRDSAGRRVLGLLADRFLSLRGYERLGFARIGDYSTERLGWSARQLQDIARVSRLLTGLPQIEQAFLSGRVGWTKVRLLVSLATPSDEDRWLAISDATDVRQLAAITSSARSAANEQRPIDTGTDQGVPGDPHVGGEAHAPFAEDDSSDHDETSVLLRIECTRRARLLWNETRRCAARTAGRALVPWQVAELVAAEASAASAPFADVWREEPWKSLGAGRSAGHPASTSEGISTSHRRRSTQSGIAANDRNTNRSPSRASSTIDRTINDETLFEPEVRNLAEMDAFALDAAMRRVRSAMQNSGAELGRALGLLVELRLYVPLGYSSAVEYERERLGISERTARELTRVVVAAEAKSPLLGEAYAHGRLSRLQVAVLISVARPWNAAAWIARAQEVTLRRLDDEVAWALRRADLAPQHSGMMPPASGQDLGPGGDERQMCARDRQAKGNKERPSDMATHDRNQHWGIVGRIHVTLAAPLSVSIMFREVMQGFASPLEPRWAAFERMLEHVLEQWASQPRHRDPVFARDGFRCTAPACSSFSNLHDHHIIARSAGGSNELTNRTTLCAWHHLRAIHGGLANASGEAPDGINWELGLRESQPPLMRLRGDRYMESGID